MEANNVLKQVNLNVKPNVSDAKTQRIIDELYKGQNAKNKIGNGTMMDAIRYERKTGKLTGNRLHSKKGKDMVTRLNGRICSGRLSNEDKKIVRAIREDLEKALTEY